MRPKGSPTGGCGPVMENQRFPWCVGGWVLQWSNLYGKSEKKLPDFGSTGSQVGNPWSVCVVLSWLPSGIECGTLNTYSKGPKSSWGHPRIERHGVDSLQPDVATTKLRWRERDGWRRWMKQVRKEIYKAVCTTARRSRVPSNNISGSDRRCIKKRLSYS